MNIEKNLVNFVSFESHGRVEHYNQNYLGKKKELKNEDDNLQLFL